MNIKRRDNQSSSREYKEKVPLFIQELLLAAALNIEKRGIFPAAALSSCSSAVYIPAATLPSEFLREYSLLLLCLPEQQQGISLYS